MLHLLHEDLKVAREISQASISGARGCFVSTVGLDEGMVIEYIRSQEKADEQQDQLRIGL